MPSTITLYRFLAAKWALKTLREHRLHVSRISKLNDPFEWRIGAIADTPEHARIGREAFDAFVGRLDNQFGIISMCARNSDPVIWSHYADSHKGIALEFEHLRTDDLHAVTYSHALPTFDVTRLQDNPDREYTGKILREALCRKSLTWGYEHEYRIHYNLHEDCEPDGDEFFIPIPDVSLSRVILGLRCDTTIIEVKNALEAGGFRDVPIVLTTMSETAYEIVV